MADKKISQFPTLNAISASTIIPVVHDGTTFKMNVSSFANYASQWSAKTGSSNTFTGNQTINGNLTLSGAGVIGGDLAVGGMITAQQYNVTYVSSSVQYKSGSTEFGDTPDDTHTFTGIVTINGVPIGAAAVNSFTASQLAVNLGISSVTGSINTTTSSFDSVFLRISSTTGSMNVQSASQDLVNRGISSVTGSINTTTASFDSVFLRISSTTGSINTTTSSFDSVFLRISSTTGSINTTTASFDSVFLGISSITGSLIGIANGLMGFTASLDSIYATDAQLHQLYQATSSIHFATQSLNSQTGSQELTNLRISVVTGSINSQTSSQDLINYNNSVWTGSVRVEINGIEAYTASLKAAAIVSSSTQIQNYNLFALDTSVAVKASGSTLYSTSPSTTNFSQVNSVFLGGGAGQDATSADSSIFLGFNAGIQATAAQESFFAGNTAGGYATNALRSNFIGISAGGAATNASNANFIGYGVGQSATNASYANFIGSNAGFIATNATYANFIGGSAGQNATNASYSNFIGNFAGDGAANASYSNLFGFSAGKKVFGNGIGTNNIIIGTNITLENDRRDSINFGGIIFATGSYGTTSGNPLSGSVGNGKVGINKSLPSFELDISGSVGVTGSLNVTDYSRFGKSGLAKSVDFLNAIAVTGSVTTQQNTIGGFVGSFYNQWDSFGSQGGDGVASVGYFVGSQNDDRKLRLTSDADIQINHGNGVGRKIQIPRTSIGLGSVVELTGSLLVTGSFNLSGSMQQSGLSTLIGNTILSGSIAMSGSTIQTGNNTLIGNTVLSGSILVSGSSDFKNSEFRVTGSSFFTGSHTITGNSTFSGSINIASGSSYYRAGNKLFNYGQWGSVQTQSGSANTSLPIKLETKFDGSEGVSIVNNGSGFPTRITAENTGLYNIQFSLQLNTTATETCDFSVWFAMTGSNIANSNTDFSIDKTAGGGNGVAALNLLTPITAGDYVELYWSNNTGNGQLLYKAPQSTPTRPATPSAIVTITQVA